jgi:hypothetical protein
MIRTLAMPVMLAMLVTRGTLVALAMPEMPVMLEIQATPMTPQRQTLLTLLTRRMTPTIRTMRATCQAATATIPV